MTTIQVRIIPAPVTPLNLQFGVAYAPRIETPPFVAFSANEVEPGVFEIWAYDATGGGVVTYRGGLLETFQRVALHLRMDTA